MYTPRINSNPALTKQLVAKGVFGAEPLSLVDVGASGGVDTYWHNFRPCLRAFGFEPLVQEVERLNAQRSADTQYLACLVGCKKYDDTFPPSLRSALPDNQPFPRTSAARAQTIQRRDSAGTYKAGTHSVDTSRDLIELDEFFLETHPLNVDFVKIDTDGSDYQVLLGARKLLSQSCVLGVGVECQFHELLHEASNTFANINRLLRELGFSLFDIEVYRHSRAVLHKQFVYKIPAQTAEGQVLRADALYLRDAGDSKYEKMWPVRLLVAKLLKLVCLFELFGLDDCAAKLLVKYRTELCGAIEIDACLDLLTPRLDGNQLSYRRYNEEFDRNTELCFPRS